MALVSKCVVTEPSSFEEVVEDLAWVDAIVEEYDSIVRNSAWEIVPRPEGKSVVDWAGSPTDRKSTSGGIFSIWSTTVSWYSRKQRSVALSSAKPEYMAASLAACEAIWMRKILVVMFGSHLEPTMIYCDNQSCIKLSANPVFHDRSKHIDIRYHHIRDCVQRRIMLLSYIPTKDQDVDILTKALTRRKLKYHRGRIGNEDNPYLVEREC
eukprot:PITA_17545